MLTIQQAKSNNFLFQDKLKNYAWISGRVKELAPERKTFWLQISNNETDKVLVKLSGSDYLPVSVQENTGIKIFARLMSEIINSENSIYLSLRAVDSADIFELPKIKLPEESALSWNPYEALGYEVPSGTAVNELTVAGFMHSLVQGKKENGEINPSVLEIELQTGIDSILPIYVTNRTAKHIFNTLKGLKNNGYLFPMFFQASLKTKTIANDSGESLSVTYIHATKVSFVDTSNSRFYFLGKPDWLQTIENTNT